MIKLSVSTLAIVVAMGGLSAPALATSLLDNSSGSELFNETIVLQQLRARGVDATDLQEWGDRIRATVRLEDGRVGFVYFRPGTLEQVPANGIGGGNTRVLSQRSLGQDTSPRIAFPESLVTSENEDD